MTTESPAKLDLLESQIRSIESQLAAVKEAMEMLRVDGAGGDQMAVCAPAYHCRLA